MRKAPALATFALLAMIVPFSFGAAQVTPQDSTLNVVDAFNPWLADVISQHFGSADKLFPIQPDAQTVLTAGHSRAIFNRLSKIEGLELSLIGRRILGNHTGTLMFTGTIDRGPFAIKISYYRYGDETRIGKVEIIEGWADIETMTLTIDPLPQPVTVTLVAPNGNG